MASINGISLGKITSAFGMEGLYRAAPLYLDGVEIGSFTEDSVGGNGILKSSPEKKKIIIERAKEHYEKYPRLDRIQLSFMSKETYLEKRDTRSLPTTSVSLLDEYTILDIFMYELFDLTENERLYRKARLDGYADLCLMTFVGVKNHPCPSTVIRYYTSGDDEIHKKVLNEARTKHFSAEMTVYSNLEDFEIK